MTPNALRFRWPLLGLLGLLAIAWWVYLPGLSGGFLFDDFPNLDALGASGRVDDWATFWRYITSGSADPTGRPLALLSFLVDARDWPADPRPFLRTNVLLHLANATVLYALLRQLGRRLASADGAAAGGATALRAPGNGAGAAIPAAKGQPTGSPAIATRWRVDLAALLAAGAWSLHPLFVSTTLYVVQREAVLATTFVLLGLLAWSRGRSLVAQAPRAGTAWMLGGIVLGTILAVLCKANGALLPLLALTLEATVYRERTGSPLARRLRWLLLVLPALALFGYVLSRLGQWSQPLAMRPWTIGERVLTEPRVLLDYLRVLIVPHVLSTGVYNDGYPWSTGLLRPWTTLPAMLAIIALVGAGFALRRRAPALAAAVLFFFAGHLLESTTIPLELYFEHRNYLPAMLLGWPLARAIVRWRVPVALRASVALAILGLLAATTWQRTTLWADQPRMAGLWAATTPDSSRAIATQALFDIHAARPDLAIAILSAPWQRKPYDLQLALNYLNATCQAQGPTPATISAVDAALRNATEGDQLMARWLGQVLDATQVHGCPGVTPATVERWTRAALANPRLAAAPGRSQQLHAILGRVALSRGDGAAALRQFRQALDAWPTPASAAQQSAWLAAAGYPAQGLALLDHYDRIQHRRQRPHGFNMPTLHQWVLDRQGYWPHEFSELRHKMHDDLAAGGKAP
ncbi:tetratricopeptide repeat protein [Cognatiluteimonas telluris]|uniref:tetratricopeptide repeat protein n=1 Tax=Cognatiluteimonas telluris TaxID=1104775 RepID=UPI001A9C4DC8|nr:tetratricopeptide repeat protein [Lysobacter telluris]